MLPVAVFIFFTIYFLLILYCRVATDIQDHARIAYSFSVNHDRLSPNFLYFFLVALLSGFSKHYPVYYVSSILVLSLAVTAKFLLNKVYIEKYTWLRDNKTISSVLSFILLFVFALPGAGYFYNNSFYLGQLTPTVWHNSTMIFLMPFSLLLFFKSYQLLFTDISNSVNKLIIQIIALVILNALIKPSFLFTLLPSVFLFLVYNHFVLKAKGNKIVMALPYLLAVFFVGLQYFVIYKLNYTSGISKSITDGSTPEIIIAPFKVWKGFSDNIPLSIVTSLLFPLLYIILSKGEVLKNKLVQFAFINFVFGLLIWIIFSEQGRVFHANFYWQIIVTLYLLFFSMVIDFANRYKLKQLGKAKQLVIGGAFLLHFTWGLFYWVKIIIFSTYA